MSDKPETPWGYLPYVATEIKWGRRIEDLLARADSRPDSVLVIVPVWEDPESIVSDQLLMMVGYALTDTYERAPKGFGLIGEPVKIAEWIAARDSCPIVCPPEALTGVPPNTLIDIVTQALAQALAQGLVGGAGDGLHLPMGDEDGESGAATASLGYLGSRNAHLN